MTISQWFPRPTVSFHFSQHCCELLVCLLTVCLALHSIFLALSINQTTWLKVNRDFGSIFSTLLPGTSAKLQPPEGETVMAGLEVRKDSVTYHSKHNATQRHSITCDRLHGRDCHLKLLWSQNANLSGKSFSSGLAARLTVNLCVLRSTSGTERFTISLVMANPNMTLPKFQPCLPS